MFATLDRKVARLRGVALEAAVLESTMLMAAYGMDLYNTRLTPSKSVAAVAAAGVAAAAAAAAGDSLTAAAAVALVLQPLLLSTPPLLRLQSRCCRRCSLRVNVAPTFTPYLHTHLSHPPPPGPSTWSPTTSHMLCW